MNGTGLLPTDRLAADRVAADLARQLLDSFRDKPPARRAVVVRLCYLVGEEALLAPEPAPAVEAEPER